MNLKQLLLCYTLVAPLLGSYIQKIYLKRYLLADSTQRMSTSHLFINRAVGEEMPYENLVEKHLKTRKYCYL